MDSLRGEDSRRLPYEIRKTQRMLRQVGQFGDVGVRNIVRTIRGEAPALGLQQDRSSSSKWPQQPRGLDQGCHCSIGGRLWVLGDRELEDVASETPR